MVEEYKEVVILGGGLAGSIMQVLLGKERACIIEQAPGFWQHKALFRFKVPELGLLLGLDLKEIVVYKGVYYRGKLYNKSNILFSNLYSLKVTDSLLNRSIMDLEAVTRWVFSKDSPGNFMSNQDFLAGEVTALGRGWVDYRINDEVLKERKGRLLCRIIVSTLPMDWVVNQGLFPAPIEGGLDFWSAPVWVYRGMFRSGFCDVYQTIYFPDSEFPVYRASIDPAGIIIESIRECSDQECLEVFVAFGLQGITLRSAKLELFIQKRGKIRPLQDEIRRSILYKLTNDFDIYSLGRFALWKNLKSDEILKDAVKIKKYIDSPILSQKYLERKEVIL